MGDDVTDQRRVASIDRRTFLAGVGATAGVVGLTASRGAARETQNAREMVIEAQGEPWEGNYRDQFVVVTHRPDDQPDAPGSLADCDVDWADRSVTYNGILVDRVRDDPQKTMVDLFTDGDMPSIERGTPFHVSGAGTCGDGLVHLTGEAVPDAGSGETETATGTETTAETTTADGGTDTDESEGEGGSLRTRELLIEEQGGPWEGNYAGQFVVVTYRPDDQPTPPQSISNCTVDWSVEESVMYNGLLIDNLRDDPQKTELNVFTDGSAEEIERGTPFIVSKTGPCGGSMIRLTGEAVPNAPSVEGTAGPAVENSNETGDTDSGTGMPGFGALVGLGGLAGGTLLHAMRGDGGTDD